MGAPVNRFKQRLETGEVQFGLFNGLADPIAAEIVANSGLDWMVADAEHAPHDLRSILGQLQAAAGHDTPVMVRPPVGDTVTIKRLLDLGVQSLLVPMVESAAQAGELVSAMRYPPRGVRGVAVSVGRAARWGRVGGPISALENQLCLVCQIESPAGVAAIEEIAAVEGVDALFVGPSDLGASMGLIDEPTDTAVLTAVDDAIARIVAAGRPAGVFASAPAAANRWIDAGATFVALGADVGLLARATDALAATFGRDR